MSPSASRTQLLCTCVVLLVALLSSGCGLLPAAFQPTPTSTATPSPSATATFTPEPTQTPTPTDTPTPKPTRTPTPDLTKQAEEEAEKAYQEAMEEIGPRLFDLSVDPTEGSLVWLLTDPIAMDVESHWESQYFSLTEDPIRDFVLQTDIQWDSTSGLAGCAIYFRHEEDVNYGGLYQLNLERLQAAPAWDLEYWNWGSWQKTLTENVIFDSVINDEPNSTNQVTIKVVGNEFMVWINDEAMVPRRHNKLTEGLVSIVTWQESGETECIFSNTWLWTMDPVEESNETG